jgi:hypothetical protein
MAWQELLDHLPAESTGPHTRDPYRWVIARRTSLAERDGTDAIGADRAVTNQESSMRSASTGGGWPF